MRYLLLVYSPEAAWTPDEWTACTVESAGVCRELLARGQFLGASPLHPVATAATVRVREGTTLVTTGPFAETTEQLGGFFLIEVPHLDEALAIAARLPAANKGTIEIRPVAPLAGLPDDRLLANPGGEESLARYMLLCYDDATAWETAGPAALHAAQAEGAKLTQELATRGRYLSAAPLQPITTATSLRIREGRRLVTDGPFAETREFLGGYYVILARDLNEAITVAARHPGVQVGSVEVRRLFDLPRMPTT